MKNRLIWHEKANYLAIVETSTIGFPLVHILDDEYTSTNPFLTYSGDNLIYFGWIDLGELQ